jgi:hypothetical protein
MGRSTPWRPLPRGCRSDKQPSTRVETSTSPPSIGTSWPRRWRPCTAMSIRKSRVTSGSCACTCGAGPSSRRRGKHGAAPSPANVSPSIMSGRRAPVWRPSARRDSRPPTRMRAAMQPRTPSCPSRPFRSSARGRARHSSTRGVGQPPSTRHRRRGERWEPVRSESGGQRRGDTPASPAAGMA